MRKLYLIALTSCLGMLNLEAQVKFSDVPKIGDNYTMQVFDATGIIVAADAGKNRTWDFSNLMIQDSFDLEVIDPKKEPEGSNFPSADIAILRYSIGASMISAYNTHYYKTGSSTLTKIGRVDKTKPTGGTIIFINKFGDEEVQMKLPLEYGSKNLDAWNGSWTYASSKTTWSAGQNTYEVDGTGTIKLPGKTVYNVLRVKRTRKYIRTKGSITGPVERILYEWYVPTIPFPVFAVVEEVNAGGGTNRKIGYVMSSKELKDLKGPTSTNEIQSLSAGVTIFPNPANDYMTVKIGKEESLKEISIVDLTGKIVKSIPNSKILGNHMVTLNIEELKSGIYYIRIRNIDNVISNHKIVISSN